jgi:DNA-binding transcriptional regulator PaaX
VVAASSPYFLHNVAKYFFNDKLPKMIRARARKLQELKKRKLVSFKQLAGGEVRIELTKDGKNLVRQYNLDTMQLKKPEKWDGRWRIIIYDIPQYKRQASNAFREKLRDLGLFKIQKSVWISAYDCLAELEFLCTVFDIDMDRCVHYFHTGEIPIAREVRKHFGL